MSLLKAWKYEKEIDLQVIAKNIADELILRDFSDLKKNIVSIGLSGEMGIGKTTFVRYLVKSLGSENYVTSPSFILMNEYKSSYKKEDYETIDILIEHWDIYRLKCPEEDLLYTDENLLNRKSHKKLRLIEWIERDVESLIDIDYLICFDKLIEQKKEVRNIKLFLI